MKKIIKTLLTTIVVMSLFVMPVLAARMNYSFELYVDYSDNMYDYSAANPKDDDEQASYVYTEDGNIIASDLFYMTVLGSDRSTEYTTELQVTSNTARYIIQFDRGHYAGAGTNMYLKSRTARYDVEVEGYWYS